MKAGRDFGPKIVQAHSLLTDFDIYLFRQGKHSRLYDKLGAHLTVLDGEQGTQFGVWAPNADRVFVIGDFNGWKNEHSLLPRDDGSGIWEGFLPGVGKGALYKYRIVCKDGRCLDKADPFAFRSEVPPATASIVWELGYEWSDGEWMKSRGERNSLRSPISIYECHLGSWRRKGDGSWLTYSELSEEIPKYLKESGFTHLELLPVMEHPFYGSWGTRPQATLRRQGGMGIPRA